MRPIKIQTAFRPTKINSRCHTMPVTACTYRTNASIRPQPASSASPRVLPMPMLPENPALRFPASQGNNRIQRRPCRTADRSCVASPRYCIELIKSIPVQIRATNARIASSILLSHIFLRQDHAAELVIVAAFYAAPAQIVLAPGEPMVPETPAPASWLAGNRTGSAIRSGG